MKYVGGIDIGGTKCAVSIGKIDVENHKVETVEKVRMHTPDTPEQALSEMVHLLKELVKKYPDCPLEAIGICCGSPMDSTNGIVLAPSNLSNWVGINVVTPFQKAIGVPAALQNDANACALAEWLWGAGQNCKNIIFLTFGTGMGAGLILNGQLYAGTNDMAGEVGHIRLAQSGPVGYNKEGSFEGFCSGGGIARLGRSIVREHIKNGGKSKIANAHTDIEQITAEDIGKAAEAGDELALSIYQIVGEHLGKGLSILMDVLNPEKIIIGSIFLRQEKFLRPYMEAEIAKETISYNRDVCKIVPAGLGEKLGDYAAYSVAMNKLMYKK